MSPEICTSSNTKCTMLKVFTSQDTQKRPLYRSVSRLQSFPHPSLKDSQSLRFHHILKTEASQLFHMQSNEIILSLSSNWRSDKRWSRISVKGLHFCSISALDQRLCIEEILIFLVHILTVVQENWDT